MSSVSSRVSRLSRACATGPSSTRFGSMPSLGRLDPEVDRAASQPRSTTRLVAEYSAPKKARPGHHSRGRSLSVPRPLAGESAPLLHFLFGPDESGRSVSPHHVARRGDGEESGCAFPRAGRRALVSGRDSLHAGLRPRPNQARAQAARGSRAGPGSGQVVFTGHRSPLA